MRGNGRHRAIVYNNNNGFGIYHLFMTLPTFCLKLKTVKFVMARMKCSFMKINNYSENDVLVGLFINTFHTTRFKNIVTISPKINILTGEQRCSG